MVHYRDLAIYVATLATTKILPTASPCFYPATDGLNQSLLIIFNGINRRINGQAASSMTVAGSSEEDIAELLITSPVNASAITNNGVSDAAIQIWSVDIAFSTECMLSSSQICQEPVQGLSCVETGGACGIDATWKEFLFCQALSPVSIILAGGPKAGKTEISKYISQM